MILDPGLPLERLQCPSHAAQIMKMPGDVHRIALDEVPADVRKAMGEFRGTVARGVQNLTEVTRDIDPTLKGPVQHVRSVAFDALGDLEKKIVHAVKREIEIALQQIEKAHLHLFPDNRPQERVFNPFYYLVRYGDTFVTQVAASIAAALPPLGPDE